MKLWIKIALGLAIAFVLIRGGMGALLGMGRVLLPLAGIWLLYKGVKKALAGPPPPGSMPRPDGSDGSSDEGAIVICSRCGKEQRHCRC